MTRSVGPSWRDEYEQRAFKRDNRAAEARLETERYVALVERKLRGRVADAEVPIRVDNSTRTLCDKVRTALRARRARRATIRFTATFTATGTQPARRTLTIKVRRLHR